MLASSRLAETVWPFWKAAVTSAGVFRLDRLVVATGGVFTWPPENRYWPWYWVLSAPAAVVSWACRVSIRVEALSWPTALAMAVRAAWAAPLTVVSAVFWASSLSATAWVPLT